MCKRGLVCVLLAAASALPSDPEGWGQQGPDDILVPIAPEKESRSYEKEWYPGKHLSRPGWFPGKAVDEEVVKMLPDGDRDGTPDSIAWHRASPAAKYFMEHSALGMLMICTFEADEAVPGAARPRHVTRLTPLPLRLSCQPSPHSPSPLNHEWRVGPVAAAKEAVLPASREVVCTLSVSSKPVTWLCGCARPALTWPRVCVCVCGDWCGVPQTHMNLSPRCAYIVPLIPLSSHRCFRPPCALLLQAPRRRPRPGALLPAARVPPRGRCGALQVGAVCQGGRHAVSGHVGWY